MRTQATLIFASYRLTRYSYINFPQVKPNNFHIIAKQRPTTFITSLGSAQTVVFLNNVSYLPFWYYYGCQKCTASISLLIYQRQTLSWQTVFLSFPTSCPSRLFPLPVGVAPSKNRQIFPWPAYILRGARRDAHLEPGIDGRCRKTGTKEGCYTIGRRITKGYYLPAIKMCRHARSPYMRLRIASLRPLRPHFSWSIS